MGRGPEENTAFPPERILFVEDDPALGAFLLRYVAEQGYEAEIAGDGAEMRDQLARGAFDLVVLDIGLPGRDDGYTLAREFKGQHPVPVGPARTHRPHRRAGNRDG